MTDGELDGGVVVCVARLIYEAVENAENIWNSEWTCEGSFEELAKALLAAGWTPPSKEPCTWCAHLRHEHSSGGCHAKGCSCPMPYGGN